jgi:hypothetical protein
VPYIAAVDAINADRVYVRAPATTGGDVLFVTENAGKDWTQILKAKGTLAGFALSPDGSQVAVGGPTDPLQIASSTDYVFTHVNDLGVTCLTWTNDGLFACADQATAGFSVGLSSDEGATFEPLFEPSKLSLQVCDPGTPVAESCPNAWRGLAPVIGADPATPGYESGGSGGRASGGATSSAGTSADAGDGPSGSTSAGADSVAGRGGAAAGGSGAGAMATPSSNRESSACSLAQPSPDAKRWAWLLLALSLSGWSRRRGRQGRVGAARL